MDFFLFMLLLVFILRAVRQWSLVTELLGLLRGINTIPSGKSSESRHHRVWRNLLAHIAGEKDHVKDRPFVKRPDSQKTAPGSLGQVLRVASRFVRSESLRCCPLAMHWGAPLWSRTRVPVASNRSRQASRRDERKMRPAILRFGGPRSGEVQS